jgi:uncharacterized protein (DUF2236 family)
VRPVPDPVLGFYGPGTQMWRINREAVLLGAGTSALLLQLAHPLVAEGVAQHSRFEEDPWRRLRGTLRTSLALVFGDRTAAEKAVARLNGIHARVRGEAHDPVARSIAGDRYRALDPALLLWVQATLIVSGVQAYERWVGPLTVEEKEQFWSEAREFGELLGIPASHSPADWAALESYWRHMLDPDGPIQVTPTARRLARSIIRPPMRLVPGPVVDLLVLPSLNLLPARIREAYGIPWGPWQQRLGAVADSAIRLWVRALPASWRAMPQARSAERRARIEEKRVRGERHALGPSRDGRRRRSISATTAPSLGSYAPHSW